MGIMSRVSLLLTVCSVLDLHNRFLRYFFMDAVSCLSFQSLNGGFGCGFLVFGCFKQLFTVLVLLLLFCFGLKVLQFSRFLCDFGGNSSEFSSENVFDETLFDSEVSWKENVDNYGDIKKAKVESDEEINDDKELYDEDKLFDVMSLRKLVKLERRRENAARSELEKERTAAATAAEEAMAMILRLQNEKSLIELESSQFRRLADEKFLHDQEVIRSLRWIVMKHESERSVLEDQLRSCRRRLKKLHCNGNEGDDQLLLEGIDESLRFFNAKLEDTLGDGLFSSLDHMDSSPL